MKPIPAIISCFLLGGCMANANRNGGYQSTTSVQHASCQSAYDAGFAKSAEPDTVQQRMANARKEEADCQSHQVHPQYASPVQQISREDLCQDVYSATLLAPSRGFADGLSKAMIARDQCLAGQPIVQQQPAPMQPAPQSEQGMHTYTINGRLMTCNTFGTNTTCN